MKQNPGLTCRICKAEGRVSNHPLASCHFVSRAEKQAIIQSFRVDADDVDGKDDSTEILPEEFDYLAVDQQE